MESSMQVAVNTVKSLIEKADKAKAHLIFFNRHGEIDTVSTPNQEPDTQIWDELASEARARSGGGPCFLIISIAPSGNVFIPNDDGGRYVGDADDDTLAEALSLACKTQIAAAAAAVTAIM